MYRGLKLVILLIFGLGGFITLISLGIWQKNRLAEKEAQIAEIAQKQASAPMSFVPTTNFLENQNAIEDALFRHVNVSGHFLEGKSLLYYGNIGKTEGIGYKLLHLFETEQGILIPVVYGYISLEEHTDKKPLSITLKEKLTLSGTILPRLDAAQFTPENNIGKNEWFSDNMNDFAEAFDVNARKILPIRLYLSSTIPQDVLGVKVFQPDITLSNSHKQYMFTWFTLALIWGIQSAYLFWRERKKFVK